MTGIKEFFQGLVADGVVSQEPVNYDAATLKIYIAHLEAENAELRERLEKAVELPRIIHPNEYEWHIQYQYESGIIDSKIEFSIEAAEARLKEIKENNDDVRRI